MANLSTDVVYQLHIRLAGAHFDPELFSLQAVNSAFTLLAT